MPPLVLPLEYRILRYARYAASLLLIPHVQSERALHVGMKCCLVSSVHHYVNDSSREVLLTCLQQGTARFHQLLLMPCSLTDCAADGGRHSALLADGTACGLPPRP
jgi:hypothetical protein